MQRQILFIYFTNLKGRLETQVEKQMRKPGSSKSTKETLNNKEHGINHIDTAFLFTETTSEMKIFGHRITSHCIETS